MKTYMFQLTGETVSARDAKSARRKLEKSFGAGIDPKAIVDVSAQTEARASVEQQGDDDSVYLKAK